MKSITNIIQVVSYYPPHLGGMENCVKEFSERLAERGYSVTVNTSNIGVGKTKALIKKNLRVLYLKSIEFAHTPIIFLLFSQLLRLSTKSIMHLHISQAFTPEIVYLVSKLRKIRYIAHIHLDVDPSGPFGFLLKPYKKFLLKPVLHHASKIICLSDLQKEQIAKKYNLNKSNIVVLSNGVGDSYFMKRQFVKKAIPTILFVGRLSPQKNVLRLVKAVHVMKMPVNVQIVGEGEERNKIEQTIKELKLTNVTLLGKKTGNELIALYKNADIFVLTSNKEGIPLVLLEAMAAGLPIVASNISGVNELLGDSGYLVNNPSPETFASALDIIASDIDIQKSLSQKAQRKAMQYNWDKIVDKLETIYKEVSL